MLIRCRVDDVSLEDRPSVSSLSLLGVLQQRPLSMFGDGIKLEKLLLHLSSGVWEVLGVRHSLLLAGGMEILDTSNTSSSSTWMVGT